MSSRKIRGGNIRPFELQDLAWLKPIADAYDEWDDFVHVLQKKQVISAFVVPGKALAILFKDGERYMAAGLTGKTGIRDFIRMVNICIEPLRELEIPIYRYKDIGRWQEKLANRLGIKEIDDGEQISQSTNPTGIRRRA